MDMEDKGRKSVYDIEEILLEAQQLKQNRQNAAARPSSPSPASPRPKEKEKTVVQPPESSHSLLPVQPIQKPEPPVQPVKTSESPAKPAQPVKMPEQSAPPAQKPTPPAQPIKTPEPVFPEEKAEPKEKKRGFFSRWARQETEEIEELFGPGVVPIGAHRSASNPPLQGNPPVVAALPKEEKKPAPKEPEETPSPAEDRLPQPPVEEDEDVRIYQPPEKPITPPESVIPPISAADEATRLVDLPADKEKRTEKPVRRQPEREDDEMDGQIRLYEFFEEETPEEEEEDGNWEERLRTARQEKVKTFRLLGDDKEDGFKFSGEDEELNDPADEMEDFEDEELEDYNSYEETDAVQAELTYRRRTGWITLILTGVSEGVLLFMTLLSFLTVVPPIDVHFYIAIHAFLLGLMLLVNHQMVGQGVSGVFRMKADADGAVSVASLFALLHTLLQFFNGAAVATGKAPLFTAVAGLGLFFGAIGRQMRLSRICENFRFVSHTAGKFTARRIDDPQTAVEIGRSAVALGEPDVAYFKQTGFLKNFLKNSYGDDGSDRTMRVYVPIAVLASILLGVSTFLLGNGSLWDALSAGVGTLCLSSPVAALMASNFPLLRCAKRTLRRGAMLIGWSAVQEFGGIHALAVDARDLFPSESVLLHGIKTFSGARIDRALLDAAAVSIAAGGPLSGVFRRVIQDKTDMLAPVDTLVYENDMGLSGWVGGRRVLIGNRRLLENHGVDVPSRDYESRYAKGDRQLVYLSTAGELSAMFVVSYVADEGIQRSLHDLQKSGLTLLVRTCDPNVTEKLICDTFEMDSYYVEVMGVTAGRSYEKLVHEPETENAEAILASNGRIEGMAAAMTSCRRLRSGVALAVIAQVVGGALGLALSVFLAFTSTITLPPLYMLGWLIGWTALSWILPLFKRI